GLQPNRPSGVRCSAWLGVRNLIHTTQKYIRVAVVRDDANSSLCGEPAHPTQKYLRAAVVREDANSPLCGQPCRATARGNANERNANAATRTSIPNPVSNVNTAAKSAIWLGCSLPGQSDNGLSVQGIISRC